MHVCLSQGSSHFLLLHKYVLRETGCTDRAGQNVDGFLVIYLACQSFRYVFQHFQAIFTKPHYLKKDNSLYFAKFGFGQGIIMDHNQSTGWTEIQIWLLTERLKNVSRWFFNNLQQSVTPNIENINTIKLHRNPKLSKSLNTTFI